MSSTGVRMSKELTGELLRSAWVVEAARTLVFARWSHDDRRFEAARARAAERGGLVLRALQELGRKPDEGLVEPHAAWMEGLAGAAPGEVTFGDLLLTRLGDWVEAHAGPFLGSGEARLHELAEEERSSVVFPEQLPAAPPFERIPSLELEPPGEVRFRFGILGDLHIGSDNGEKMGRAAISDLNASGAELVVQLGDITDHGNRDEFELAVDVLAQLEMPYATMMGNHDILSRREGRLTGPEYYPASFGRQPDGVLLEHEGVRFAVLDSAEVGASPFAPFNLLTGTFMEGPGGAIVRGSLTPPQHEILAEVAAPGSGPAFVFLHHPPQPFTGFPPIIFGLRDSDSGRLHATCDSGNVWGVFAGHTHRNHRTRTYGTVPVHEVSMPGHFPFGYALVDVADDGYVYRFVQISNEELLRDAYPTAGELHRRYALGPDVARGFVWTRSGAEGV